MSSTVNLNKSVPLDAKWAFTTRRVKRSDAQGVSCDLANARSGDLVLGQIIRIGQHPRLQLAEGRYSGLYEGDTIVVTCGDRYAPDQFEAIAELDPEVSDLVAGGGIVGRSRKSHGEMSAPTKVKPLGLLTDAAGEVINIERYALSFRADWFAIPVIVVVGTSMTSGKTTTASSLAHGLSRAGYRVAGMKATGTGAFGDVNAFRDAGVPIVADFTDVGMASTYRRSLDRIEQGFGTLMSFAAESGANIAVVELADGVCQFETAGLLERQSFRNRISGFLFAAPDALGVAGGVSYLRGLDIEPLVVSGVVCSSPLAMDEAEALSSVCVVTAKQLRDPDYAAELVADIMVNSNPGRCRVA